MVLYKLTDIYMCQLLMYFSVALSNLVVWCDYSTRSLHLPAQAPLLLRHIVPARNRCDLNLVTPR